jgi:ComF family protein
VLCSDPSDCDRDLCSACTAALPTIKHACSYCALPLIDVDATVCGVCLRKQPAFDHTIALCYYQQPLEKFISQLKFHRRLEYAKVLGSLLAERLTTFYENKTLPECIIPMPLHRKRLQERGYNQALEIARPIAKRLKLPLNTKHCQRIRATKAQSSLPAHQRRANIFQAFDIAKTLRARHVAIIDDVVTTGSTVAELSQALREVGVEKIDIWCCARTKVV